MAKIDMLFEHMLSSDASDLHLSEGQPPKLRCHGRITNTEYPVLTAQNMQEYLQEICSDDRWEYYLDKKDLDFAYSFGEKARFRANYFFQENGMGAVFRVIPSEIKTLEELRMPAVLKSFCYMTSGLVLMTGPTGSGKSTTLAAVINEINATSARHIITIEEPVEFVHKNKQSIICQREVGLDTNSFADALKNALRQDADVILVGEMRDYETISLAVKAAASGVLVFGTLHTNSAIKTVDRIIDAFPSDQQAQIRTMLSSCLKGVCAQLLLKTKDKKGRVACNEVLIGTTALASSIREGNVANIRNIIQGGKAMGMQLMDDSIQKALSDGKISGEEAYIKATEKMRFSQYAPL